MTGFGSECTSPEIAFVLNPFFKEATTLFPFISSTNEVSFSTFQIWYLQHSKGHAPLSINGFSGPLVFEILKYPSTKIKKIIYIFHLKFLLLLAGFDSRHHFSNNQKKEDTMKLLFCLMLSITSLSVLADENCKSLSPLVGTYNRVSQTCSGFSSTLEVSPFDYGYFKGYSLNTAGLEIQVTILNETNDQCLVTENSIQVKTCTDSTPCFPKNWIYTFKGNEVVFSADGCEAKFVK